MVKNFELQEYHVQHCSSCTCNNAIRMRYDSHLELVAPSGLRVGGVKQDFPAELEYLQHVDQLVIKQVKEIVESMRASTCTCTIYNNCG